MENKLLKLVCRRFRGIAVLLTIGFSCQAHDFAVGDTVARQWNEALLNAIRIDFPAPTVHSRNLYHTSAAMYDAWSAYDQTSTGHFYTEKHTAVDTTAARNEAISYAAYRILSQRYSIANDPASSQALFDAVMDDLGYDKNETTTVGDSPAAIGNRIAAKVLGDTINDGSNETNGYVDTTGYTPINTEMTVDYPAVVPEFSPPLADPNRWQPLFVDSALTQNGLIGFDKQEFIGPHWGDVTTFALSRTGNPQPYSWSGIDPGAPPLLGGVGDQEYRDDTVLLIEYSNALDPTQGPGNELINISPNTAGNRQLGTHIDQGYATNPVTGQPYADNFVRTADYGRVLAEFWADGPESETPPGHWNVIANEVSDNPLLEKRIGGVGPVVGDLEWDVKLYFSMNGAVHDAAVAAWGAKAVYDYVRPITKIRYQGGLGQSTDMNLPSYHEDGLPLQDGLIELITAETIAPGGKHRNAYENANTVNGAFVPDFILTEAEMIGKIAINAWNHEPADPETELSGIDWILAENWVPYQSDNFVTPAFAAYVSGHSTFSRAAAEIMALFTGSEYFPGGLGEMTFTTEFLDFEVGPSEEITLQWASYFDAADEAGISRLWGGIHVPVDDFAGRIMGSSIGQEAFALAASHFVPETSSVMLMLIGLGCTMSPRSTRRHRVNR
ncbi:MAG: vanadium-dependent haloperoxidase [Planctomycetota bacterium]